MDLGCRRPPSQRPVGKAMAVSHCPRGQESEVTHWASTAPKFQNLAPWDEVLGTGQEDGRQREPSAASMTLTDNPYPSPNWEGP